MNNIDKKEINNVFYELDIPISEGIGNEGFEVWEVPPITRDMHLYTESG